MYTPVIFALLPEDKVLSIMTKASSSMHKQKIKRKYPDYPILNYDKKDKYNKKGYALPHVTLVQAVIDSRRIDEISNKMQEFKKYHNLHGKIIGVTSGKMSGLSHVIIDRSPELMKLHKGLLKSQKKFFIKEWNVSQLDVRLNPTTAEWIKNFIPKASLDNYSPHITLGEGNCEIPSLEFRFSRIVLCELGDNCTARKILAYVNL